MKCVNSDCLISPVSCRGQICEVNMKRKVMTCGCVVEQYGDDDPELIHCQWHRRDPGQDIPPEWLDQDGKLVWTKFDEPDFWMEP